MTSPQPAPIKLRELAAAWRWKHRLCFLPAHLIFDAKTGERRYNQPGDDRDPFSPQRRIPGKEPR